MVLAVQRSDTPCGIADPPSVHLGGRALGRLWQVGRYGRGRAAAVPHGTKKEGLRTPHDPPSDDAHLCAPHLESYTLLVVVVNTPLKSTFASGEVHLSHGSIDGPTVEAGDLTLGQNPMVTRAGLYRVERIR